MVRKVVCFILSMLSALSAQDLKTTVGEAVSTNPLVLERLKSYNSKKEDIDVAKSGYYPKLDLSIGVGTENTKRTKPSESFDFGVYQNSLTLTQNIFKGFQTDYKVKQEEHKIASAAYSYVEQVNNIAFEMVNAYILVIKQKELLKNSLENIQVNQEIFSKVKKLYSSGLTTLSEVNKIEASLALAKSNYVVQENTLLDYRYKFEKILGKHLEIEKLTKPELNIVLPSSLDDAARFAVNNNPSILVSEHNIKLAKAAYYEKKSPFYPQIDIEVAQLMNKNLSGVEGEDDRFRAMVYLRYNLFNGFADKSGIQKNAIEIDKENEIQNSLKRSVIEQISLAWAANEKLSEQLEHLQKYQDYASKTLTLYIKEYDLGRRSLLDLLSAQNDFIGSKSQIINTEHSLLFAKYRILDSMGVLVPTVIGKEASTPYSQVELHSKEDISPVKINNN